MKVYGTWKTSFKTVRFNDSGSRYKRFLECENKIIEHIDKVKTPNRSIIPIKVNNIGRLWTF